MFEQEFEEFGFEFHGECEDGKFYCDSVPEDEGVQLYFKPKASNM